MNELRILIEELRERNLKHGCTALDIISFCDRAESYLPPKEFGTTVEAMNGKEISEAAMDVVHEVTNRIEPLPLDEEFEPATEEPE